MKTELKAKFLQHLVSQKKKNEGFTLIELLVVVIIIGILAAIALPSMLNQASKDRTAGALSQAGAVNRAQQAYRLEFPSFATALTQMKIGTATADGYGAPTDINGSTTALATITYTPTSGVDAKAVTGTAQVIADGTTTVSVTALP